MPCNGGTRVSVHEGGSEQATPLRGGTEGEARGGFDSPELPLEAPRWAGTRCWCHARAASREPREGRVLPRVWGECPSPCVPCTWARSGKAGARPLHSRPRELSPLRT